MLEFFSLEMEACDGVILTNMRANMRSARTAAEEQCMHLKHSSVQTIFVRAFHRLNKICT